ncbi:unnamed protein product, partial [Aphanomyces euteiches]
MTWPVRVWRVYKSPAIIDAITTGPTVLNTLLFVDMDRADALGYTFKPDGSAVAAGYSCMPLTLSEISSQWVRLTLNLKRAMGTVSKAGRGKLPELSFRLKSMAHALIGADASTDSPNYYGKVTIAKQENDRLVLTWGIYSKPLVATMDPSTFIWALDYGAGAITFNVTG